MAERMLLYRQRAVGYISVQSYTEGMASVNPGLMCRHEPQSCRHGFYQRDFRYPYSASAALDHLAPENAHSGETRRVRRLWSRHFVRGFPQPLLMIGKPLTAPSANVAGLARLIYSILIIRRTDLTYLRLQHGMWT